jgi:hypothetical protein
MFAGVSESSCHHSVNIEEESSQGVINLSPDSCFKMNRNQSLLPKMAFGNIASWSLMLCSVLA